MMAIRFHPEPRRVSGFRCGSAAKFGIGSGQPLGVVVGRRFRQFSGNSMAESHHVAAPRSQLSTEPTGLPAVVAGEGARGSRALSRIGSSAFERALEPPDPA